MAQSFAHFMRSSQARARNAASVTVPISRAVLPKGRTTCRVASLEPGTQLLLAV